MPSVFYGFFNKLYELFELKPNLHKAIYVGLLLVLLALGIYLRALPGLHYGLEFFEADSFIEYWQAKYIYEKGPLAWYALTRDNPDTHIFWYPNGRDFTRSSYPGLPMWIGLTYHIVKYFNISLREWACLTPLVFATLSYITLYLAVREISRNNKYAVISAFTLYSLMPAASDRSIAGFVEKEGVALTFIFLTVFFYSKLARMINDKKYSGREKIVYTILTSLAIAIVGWFWGGYIYILGTFIGFIVLYPIFNSKAITLEYIKYHLILIILAIVFELVSPANLFAIGLLPFKPKSIGLIMLCSILLPLLFNILHVNYKKIGLKKPILNSTKYFFIIVALAILVIVLYAQGIIHIGDRFAWALGLRVFKPAPPLVESIEEHQSPLSSPTMFNQMLNSWGSSHPALILFSPLFMAIFGIFYLIYRGGMDQVYLAIAFALGFYSYLNAAYMEATAASTGILVAASFIGFVMSKIIPSREEIIQWRIKKHKTMVSNTTRLIAFALTVLVFINIGLSGVKLYEIHSIMIPGVMSGFTPIRAKNDVWYKVLDFISKNLTRDAVVISWWDYGYPLSVSGGVSTIADGATLNGTQIKLLAKLLTTRNESELFELAKLLKLPVNNTYILTFDIFLFEKQGNNTYIVRPYYSPYNIIGLVDIPKSIWMIRIGERNIGEYMFLYDLRASSGLSEQRRIFYISPRFDQPWDLPLIYKIMIDGILSLSMFNENTTYVFQWFTGNVYDIRYQSEYVRLKDILGIERIVSVNIDPVSIQPSVVSFEFKDRPFANSTYIKPYMIFAEPFQGIQMMGNAILMEVVFIYKLNIPF